MVNDRLVDEMISFFNGGKLPKDLVPEIETAWREHLRFREKLGEQQIDKLIDTARMW